MATLKEQKRAIENQNEEQVLKIIEEKNTLIDRFKKFEEEVEAQLKFLSPQEIEGLAQEAEILKDSLEKILEGIICLEEECGAKISSTMQEVEKKIISLQKGKKIGKGYGRQLNIRPLISKKI